MKKNSKLLIQTLDSSLSNRPQDPQTTHKSNQTNQLQSSTRISYLENLYTFEERRASLSEPLIAQQEYSSISPHLHFI